VIKHEPPEQVLFGAGLPVLVNIEKLHAGIKEPVRAGAVL
jgi:hypothetical protein